MVEDKCVHELLVVAKAEEGRMEHVSGARTRGESTRSGMSPHSSLYRFMAKRTARKQLCEIGADDFTFTVA